MIHHPVQKAVGAAVTATIVLAMSACGGGGKKAATLPTLPAPSSTAEQAPTTTTAPAAAAVDPCALVTHDEAQAIVSIPLMAAVTGGASAGSATETATCTYTSPPTGSTAQVQIFVGPGALTYLQDDRDVLHHTFTPLAGVGDEAYLETNNVFLRKGSVWVAVSVLALDAPPDQVQSGLQSLASAIVTRF